MSGVTKKLISASGGVAGGFTAIEDVFSTYLYTGNGSTQTITNYIDLDGEGGLVWIKARNDSGSSHILTDTERGPFNRIRSNSDGGNFNSSPNGLSAFNADGFTVVDDSIGGNAVNGPPGGTFSGNGTYVSWTFRKAPRFFDVVTYTGTGSQQNISHNLGGDVGFLIVKGVSAGGTSWACRHRTFSSNQFIQLNAANVVGTNSAFFPVAPTSTQFTIGTDGDVNQSGVTYVAYLFAHDPLGPSGDGSDGLIDCGSYTTSSVGAATIDLGWEPQWVLVKRADGTGGWHLADNMRGWSLTDGNVLFANTSAAESNVWGGSLFPTATGFRDNGVIGNSANIIYIAIRRGPMRAPESGTEVFHVETKNYTTNEVVNTGFPVDMLLRTGRTITYGNDVMDRLRGLASQNTSPANPTLKTNETSSEINSDNVNTFNNTGFQVGAGFTGFTSVNWSFRRAPEFFDVVAHSGSFGPFAHSLGVPPELMITKSRNSNPVSGLWYVHRFNLDGKGAVLSSSDAWFNNFGSGSPVSTSTTFEAQVFSTADQYITYLFATLAGVSKVGSYTGNGSSQTINCGFTTGARFILIKRTDASGDWYVWDTARGIVAGNDPHLSLNSTAAEVTTDDSVDPDSSGFIVNQVAATDVNVNAASYIFYSVS